MPVPGKAANGRAGAKYINLRRDVFLRLDGVRKEKGRVLGLDLSWSDFFAVWLQEQKPK